VQLLGNAILAFRFRNMDAGYGPSLIQADDTQAGTIVLWFNKIADVRKGDGEQFLFQLFRYSHIPAP